MTTLAEIERSLPWGFHDGHLEQLSIDYLGRTLTLVVRLPISKHQDVERRARVLITGLELCSIAMPWSGEGPYPRMPAGGLLIDAGEGPVRGTTLPKLPDDVFVHHILVQSWNFESMHIAARNAQLEWISEPTPRTDGERVYFPGEEIPDPE